MIFDVIFGSLFGQCPNVGGDNFYGSSLSAPDARQHLSDVSMFLRESIESITHTTILARIVSIQRNVGMGWTMADDCITACFVNVKEGITLKGR